MPHLITAAVHRRPGVLAALLTALATALALLATAPAVAQDDPPEDGEVDVTPARVSGDNRYATAAAVAALDHETSETVFVASGEDFPDALAASYAAGSAGEESGPILLVQQDDLTDPTRSALDSLDPDRVLIIGGEAAVGASVQAELEARGHDEVARIDGQDRYDTAARVAFGWGTDPFGDVGTLDGDRTALLASGETFADALAAGPVAAAAELPLFLTPPDTSHDEVDARLAELDIDRIVIVGGDAAVTGAVVAHHEARGYTVERWGGADRAGTATTVADNAMQRLGFDADLVVLARGDDFPDALTASVHAGINTAPIQLTVDPDILGGVTRSWLGEQCPDVDVIRAVGGTAAISEETLADAVQAAERCREDVPPTNQSYIIGPQEPILGAEVGHEQEFHFIGAYDDGPTDVVELALFPCDVVQRDGGFVTFTEDPDNPGYALGAGETDTGEAWISQINDIEQTRGQDRDRGIDPDGYNMHLTSEAPDCTVPVFWGIGEEDQLAELPIDEDGEPTVRFGVGQISWTDG